MGLFRTKHGSLVVPTWRSAQDRSSSMPPPRRGHVQIFWQWTKDENIQTRDRKELNHKFTCARLPPSDIPVLIAATTNRLSGVADARGGDSRVPDLRNQADLSSFEALPLPTRLGLPEAEPLTESDNTAHRDGRKAEWGSDLMLAVTRSVQGFHSFPSGSFPFRKILNSRRGGASQGEDRKRREYLSARSIRHGFDERCKCPKSGTGGPQIAQVAKGE
ncbi:hypothetical protein DFH09DRAFT_1077348 [Mycena vulgaris]|nr:hypothetical protein DFH09DRAFT_1077348 [Mycena vulgaris]